MNMQMLNENDCYATSDFPLATVLAAFLPLESVDRTQGQRVYFVFKRTGELDALLESYHRRELRIEPQAYYSEIRRLKARLYGEKD